MLIYNTLSKKKEEFKPLNPTKVTMYMCGPTVYNYFHIGNARSFIMSDIIRRYLEYKGFDVKFAMNLTDVDDNIIKQSIQEGVTTNKVSEKYTKAFFEDIRKLNIKEASIYPKATEHIPEMINLIKVLDGKKIAYNVEGNVFYDISTFKGYGKLSGKNIEELEAGARVEIDVKKKSPLDFALWKKAKPGEPYWESPWGNGRPGWHIECSAMSSKHLGETIDIHAGGYDLIFPHHENEIAQSEAANSKEFVRYWIHFGFLNIQSEKMSKSLGNIINARDFLKKYSAEVIRLFFAQTHYRGQLNFYDELLSATEKGLEKIFNIAELITGKIVENNQNGVMPEFDFDRYHKEFESAMDDDFNTPQAVAVIFDFIRDANKVISENENIIFDFYKKLKTFLVRTAQNVLGVLSFDELRKTESESRENKLIEMIIRIRQKAKEEKNYVLADMLREELTKLGIELKDGKSGTSYKKI
ncbi:MAG: cysteine--tRNA ligase [Ignavibacteria bacterium RBG_13_36_8]|nr:MAG: cysteine--tRNA ligase [Ignavibacteria bacterium RBG_13_36_8]